VNKDWPGGLLSEGVDASPDFQQQARVWILVVKANHLVLSHQSLLEAALLLDKEE
jgi:hypothetical protein